LKTTVFLGGGRITSALLAGLRIAKYGQPIVVHDRHSKKLQQLNRQFGVAVEPDLHRAVDLARVLIIAVRPDSVRDLLKEIGQCGIRRHMTAVSLIAGVPLSRLRAELSLPVEWARAMPSPVGRAGHGLTALTFARSMSSQARAEVRDLFARVGGVLEIPENQFDAFTVTYSSSHGYHALAALVSAAEAVGLDRKTAHAAAAHALADGIAAWRTGDMSLEELLREAVTPGGIAAAVVSSLDNDGYPTIVARALRAGIKRARKNARR
jgi:pyrroline-5-carboxylate reductase